MQPWYARLPEADQATAAAQTGPSPTHLPQGQLLPPARMAAASAPASASASAANSASGSASAPLPEHQASHVSGSPARTKEKRKEHKHKHKHHHKDSKHRSLGTKKQRKETTMLQEVAKQGLLADLRKERASREAAENARQTLLLRHEALASRACAEGYKSSALDRFACLVSASKAVETRC